MFCSCTQNLHCSKAPARGHTAGRHLELAQAVLEAEPRVQAEAVPRAHAPRAAPALQRRRAAYKVLHQQAHAAPRIVPPLLPAMTHVYYIKST